MNKLESYDEADTDKKLINKKAKKAKKAKFRFLRLLDKAHNIVVYIRSSGNRTDYFRKLAEKIILINNRTK